jgi:hypothetical protein
MSPRSDFSFPEPTQWNGDEPDPYLTGRSEPVERPRCARCNEGIGWGAVFSPTGTFCSRTCYDADCDQRSAWVDQQEQRRHA